MEGAGVRVRLLTTRAHVLHASSTTVPAGPTGSPVKVAAPPRRGQRVSGVPGRRGTTGSQLCGRLPWFAPFLRRAFFLRRRFEDIGLSSPIGFTY
ncbi:hypothetical protein GCM10010424_02150 [Streptomyces lienomycini]